MKVGDRVVWTETRPVMNCNETGRGVITGLPKLPGGNFVQVRLDKGKSVTCARNQVRVLSILELIAEAAR